MNKTVTTRWLERVIFAFGLVAFATGLSGCATSAASYLDRAASHGDCSESVYYYRTAILSESLKDDKLTSDYVDKAIAGLRSTVPYCSTDPAKVIEYTQNAATDLAKARLNDATEVAILAVTYMESHPQAMASIHPWFLQIAKAANNAALWKRAYGIAIDHGTWVPGDVDLITSASAVMAEEQKAFRPQLEPLREVLKAATAKGTAATTAKCDLKYCIFSNGTVTSVNEQVIAYQRAYSAELVRLGLGDSNRVAIVNRLSDEVSRRLASDNARRAQYAARASADSNSTSSMVNAMATVATMAGGMAQASQSKAANAVSLQAVASSLQTSSTTGTPSACDGSYRANPSRFAACCRARGGTWRGRVSLPGGGAEDQCLHTDGWVEDCLVQGNGTYGACRNRGVR